MNPASANDNRLHLLVTAGPTHEPIDAVRYLANRSSGRLGVALADHGAARGHRVTLLLGPSSLAPADTSVEVVRFQTTADLQRLLGERVPACDVLIMAAAVADYRPVGAPGAGAKLERRGERLTLELAPTPDLLAEASATKRADQTFVGFALEEPDRLRERAAAKLERKGLDLIVGNSLETMDAAGIRAILLGARGAIAETQGMMSKKDFAEWLLERVEAEHRERLAAGAGPAGSE